MLSAGYEGHQFLLSVPPLLCQEQKKTRKRGDDGSKDKDLSFNLSSAMGESGVCPDKPGSRWAAEMRSRTVCMRRMEERAAAGKEVIERY